MNILLLGNKAHLLENCLKRNGHICHITDNKIKDACGADFVISFGYRYIIPANVIEAYGDNMINLHISFLPWNKGADPNLWSFLEYTKKGVTIHKISEKLDGGDILIQKEIVFGDNETLKTSYDTLIAEITALFNDNAEVLLAGKLTGRPQTEKGSMHRLKDKEKYLPLLAELGYNTPVKNLIGKALCR